MIHLTPAGFLAKRVQAGFAVDEQKLDSGHGGKVLGVFTGQGGAKTGMVGVSGKNPRGAGRAEIGSPRPHRPGHWQLGQGMRRGDRIHFVDQEAKVVAEVVSYPSRFITLLPGDVISTGTPAGVGLGFNPPQYLRAGDTVELGIDHLGTQKQLCR